MSISATLVPVEEYLHTAYSPDCDYIDGRLEERHVGQLEHSDLQGALVAWFRAHATRFRCTALPEMRIQTAPDRYRVADICCVRRRPKGSVVTEPPVLIIEILSPDDTVPQTEDRISDYLAMGVPFVWLIDPKKLDRAYVYEPGRSRRDVHDRVLDAGDIIVNLNDLPPFEDFE